MDTEGAIGSVCITEVSVGPVIKVKNTHFLSKYYSITPNVFKHHEALILQTVSMKTHGSLEKIDQKLCKFKFTNSIGVKMVYYCCAQFIHFGVL